ncbi:hypothetical protein GCM10009841_05390 [Microlunatus panaciterrae]|uniref:Tat pathway signal sequence domain protein n=1 Tax=Microlunatus panaciterrae TaxID=400768 RepID=A0ABS2RIH9_9ACTN|nr:hypothetical protein [Microlunatus panaciterrae]MBM7798805.1 hypothetical protein [Microlunatus panaciterrae]
MIQPNTGRPESGVSRRALLGGGAAAAVALPLTALGAVPAQADGRPRRGRDSSVRDATRFLQQVTDAYRGSGPRLAQSYQDASGLTDIAFVYDNAVTAIALLALGDDRRARAIGDALLYAQAHDPEFSDHRLRQAYHADGFTDAGGMAVSGSQYGLVGTAVGDMAWSGIALAQLARKTRDNRYAQGALWIGQWIYDNAYAESGLGGYTFGTTAGLAEHRSTEHNIDTYAFFRLLASLTGDRRWQDRAAHAWSFVTAMWNPEAEFFWTGSDDGVTINRAAAQLPEDVQTWSWLAAGDKRYAAALDWAAGNLATTDTPLRTNSALTGNYSVSGIGFGSGSLLTDPTRNIGGQSYNPRPDVAAVWFEGTAHLALALAQRKGAGDAAAADSLLHQLRSAQDRLGAGQKFGGTAAVPGGLVAASSPLDTGFGFGYYPNLHTAATSWYLLAAIGANPYRYL